MLLIKNKINTIFVTQIMTLHIFQISVIKKDILKSFYIILKTVWVKYMKFRLWFQIGKNYILHLNVMLETVRTLLKFLLSGYFKAAKLHGVYTAKLKLFPFSTVGGVFCKIYSSVIFHIFKMIS